MPFIKTEFPGLFVFEPKVFEDARGYFFESYNLETCLDAEVDIKFVQDNQAKSVYGVIRGMHYQWDKPMDKLVRVSKGKILDIIVDIRKDSVTYGKHYCYDLSDENNNQLWVPAGFAHGFMSLTDDTHVQYKCTELYNKEGESGINPLKYFIFTNMQIGSVLISDKDKNSETFEQYCLNPKF